MENISFMEVIKNGKIALLVSEPGKGMVTFVRNRIKEDYPDVYHMFFTGSGYIDASDVKMAVDEENTEILAIDCNYCNSDLFDYLETLKDKMGVIVFVHDVPEHIKNNSNYVQYIMNNQEERKIAYYGEHRN